MPPLIVTKGERVQRSERRRNGEMVLPHNVVAEVEPSASR